MANEAKNGGGALTQDEISLILSEGRARNAYSPKLQAFADSDDAGVDPAKEWPVEFGGKQATTLYQGFLGAAKKLKMEDRIQVIKRGERVVLIDKTKVEVAV